jgi:type I restriction enzyme, S subunit
MFAIMAKLDRETSERAGAGGMFQVEHLEDDEGNDLTFLVNQGHHFQSMEELRQAILKEITERLTLEEV